MRINLTCPAGHVFVADAAAASSGMSCPECGHSVRLTEPETPSRADDEPTVAYVPRATVAAGTLPRKLGRFELLEEVGHGGYGTVYRAHDPQLDREVAIKLPRAGVLVDDRDADRFLREARAAGRLRHPNIVPMYDAGQIDGVCYIASGFVNGRSLHDTMDERGRFPPREAALLVARLAGALDYAHDQGVIHRDIKPANIMVDAQGEPHVMDFGLARRFEGEALRTQEGARMGTPAYMSPEQAAGQSHLADARSDLWSLGVILYELLTQRRPFLGTGHELCRRIIDDEPSPPRRLHRNVPRDLETICLRCLNKRPADRYARAGELAADLNRWLRHEPIRARRVPAWERVFRWTQRKPIHALLGIAIALGLSVSIYFAFRALTSERELVTKSGAVEREAARASAAETDVEQQRKRVQEERSSRQVAENRERFADYARLIGQAGERIDAGDVAAARTLLDQCEPSLRHWEWYRLSCLCGLATIPTIGSGGRSVAWNPKGTQLIVVDPRGEAAVWDSATRQLLFRLHGPSGAAQGASDGTHYLLGRWSPEGDLLALTTNRGHICVFQAETGQMSLVVPAHRSSIATLAWAPDGRRIVSHSNDEHRLCVWDVTTGDNVLEMPHPGMVTSLDWHAALNRLLVAGQLGFEKHPQDGVQFISARILNPQTGEILQILKGSAQPAFRAAWSLDGIHVASGGMDGSTSIWEAGSGALIATEPRHAMGVSAIEWTRDGHVVSASIDGAVQVWKPPGGPAVAFLNGHVDGVVDVDICASTGSIATCSAADIALWGTETVAAFDSRTLVVERTSFLGWSGDGRSVVAYDPHDEGRLLRVFDAANGAAVELAGVPDDATILAWPATGSLVAAATPRNVVLCDGQTGRISVLLDASATVLRWAPDGIRLAVLSAGQIEVFHVIAADTQPRRESLVADGGALRSAEWSPDGRLMACATGDGRVLVLDATASASPRLVYQGDPGDAAVAGWNADGRLFAILHPGGHKPAFGGVSVWRTDDWSRIALLPGYALAWSPDGQRLAIGGGDGVTLWALDSAKELLRLRNPGGIVTALAWSPDGRRLAASGFGFGSSTVIWDSTWVGSPDVD